MRHQKFFACLKHVFVLVKLNLSPFFEPSPLHFELQCFQGAGADACCGIEQLKNHASQLHTATQRTWSRAESWQTSTDTIWQPLHSRLWSAVSWCFGSKGGTGVFWKILKTLVHCQSIAVWSWLALPCVVLSNHVRCACKTCVTQSNALHHATP